MSVLKSYKWLLIAIVIVALGGLLFAWKVLYPGYLDSENSMYGSKLGHPAMLRKLGKPIPVKSGRVEEHTFERVMMGEGVCASEPFLVPVIPMAKVVELNVQEGQRVEKGQVLAKLDRVKAEIKLESAALALSSARSEFERVKLGSAYVLAQERPELDQVNLTALKNQLKSNGEKLKKYESAFDKGAISEAAFLEMKNVYEENLKQFKKAEIFLGMSEEGLKESLKIAENTVNDMEKSYEHRQEEMRDYEVTAPASGVIERVLIRPGEYNQDSGKPGFVIAAGKWFEAHFDQSDFPFLKEGQGAEVYLEAFSGKRFLAEVSEIIPVVSFNQGGPEISRPLRPRGTGSPEWAATFRAKLLFQDDDRQDLIALGMTGFGSVKVQGKSLSVPRGAVRSISAGQALVDVPTDDGGWKSMPVKVGLVTPEKVEILSGLEKGAEVLIAGNWVLEPNDKIQVHDD